MKTIKEKIIEIISKPQVSGLATITEDGKPWVRNVVTVGSDDMILKVATFRQHRKVKHIMNNPSVHLSCGVNSITEEGPYMQIAGIGSIDDSNETKNAFWNPGLARYFSGPEDPNYVVLKIEIDRVEYIDPEDITKPEIWNRAG